jgi:hypothetical protein
MLNTRTRAVGALATLALVGGAATTASGHTDEEMTPAKKPMSVDFKVKQAPNGLLINIKPKGFKWAPQHMSAVHGKGKIVQGRGHGHVYLDGSASALTMIVGPWTYLKVPAGKHKLKVVLNADTHVPWARGGKVVSKTRSVKVAEPMVMPMN